jgi:hypothetical protein
MPSSDGSDPRETEQMEPTKRSARFYAPLTSEADVEAIAQRVAQHCAVALQRKEADAVQVIVQEAERK